MPLCELGPVNFLQELSQIVLAILHDNEELLELFSIVLPQRHDNVQELWEVEACTTFRELNHYLDFSVNFFALVDVTEDILDLFDGANGAISAFLGFDNLPKAALAEQLKDLEVLVDYLPAGVKKHQLFFCRGWLLLVSLLWTLHYMV